MRRCFSPADLRKAALGLLAGIVALVIAFGHGVPVQAAAPVSASGSDQPAGKNCVSAEEARVRAAGDSGEEAPPKFSAAIYKRLLMLDVSLDGADGNELPIAIEEVCNVPKALKKQASQLAGGDGVALLLPRTSVWQGETQVTGEAVATAIDGADTAVLRVRLIQQQKWHKDEDGGAVPTFRTGRIEITD